MNVHEQRSFALRGATFKVHSVHIKIIVTHFHYHHYHHLHHFIVISFHCILIFILIFILLFAHIPLALLIRSLHSTFNSFQVSTNTFHSTVLEVPSPNLLKMLLNVSLQCSPRYFPHSFLLSCPISTLTEISLAILHSQFFFHNSSLTIPFTQFPIYTFLLTIFPSSSSHYCHMHRAGETHHSAGAIARRQLCTQEMAAHIWKCWAEPTHQTAAEQQSFLHQTPIFNKHFPNNGTVSGNWSDNAPPLT